MAQKPTVSLKGKALRSLAQREHSRAELEFKLLRHLAQTRSRDVGADEPEVDADGQRQADRELVAHTLDDLAAAGFQSDERTAASLIRTQGPRYGGLALKQRLQAKGLPAELVTQSLAQARDSELTRALELWRRRFGEVSSDPLQQAKQARFLAARGFDSAVVRRVVRGLAIND